MRNLKLVILAAPVIAIYSFAIVARHQGPRKVVDTHVYEPLIRGEATNAPTPEYPAEAIDARLQGLVDVAVVFDENGKTIRIKILESPGPSLSKAVESAVRQWTMRGGLFTLEHIPVRTVGELRFHFVIKDGVGSVETPSRDEQEIRSPAFRRVIEEETARPRN